jgi:osmotically-inducible protein OsmY
MMSVLEVAMVPSRAQILAPARVSVAPQFETLNEDKRIEQRARTALAIHPHFRGRDQWVRLNCRHRCLRLSGRLPSWHLRQLAQEAVREVSGIRRLANRICVASPEGIVGEPAQ